MIPAWNWGKRWQAHRMESLGAESKVRLLVAEDDDAFREVVSSHLRKAGAQVFETHDGSQLLETLGELTIEVWPGDPVDAIISDIRMPGLDGLGLVRELRRTGSKLPVVLMTAFSDERMRGEAKALHARVVDKPFDMEELLEAVAAALDEH